MNLRKSSDGVRGYVKTVSLLFALFLSVPASTQGVTFYLHLRFPGDQWFYGHADSINTDAPIRTATWLPAGRYLIEDSTRGWIGQFTTYSDTPPDTFVQNISIYGDPCNLNFCPYGTRDFHAVYLVEYYSQAIVGTAAGGFTATQVAIVGGQAREVPVEASYTVAYGDLPPDLNDTGGDGEACTGMARYALNKLQAVFIINDTPIGYAPPRGPTINFTLTYNSKARQPGGYGFPHLGPGWTFNWYSYLIDDPNNVSVTIYLPGGAVEQTSGYNSQTQSYAPDRYSRTVVARVTSGYERRFPDGSKQVFTTSEPEGRFFLTQWVDKANNPITLAYDHDPIPSVGKIRLRTITDAVGNVTTLYYNYPENARILTSISNNLGKTASFGYTDGQLTSITDPVGIVSRFGWEDDAFINSLTTPYGTTIFSHGGNGLNHWIEVTDPELGRERVEYRDFAPGIAATDPPATVPTGFSLSNTQLDVRNTFYWDKKAMQIAPGDYTRAKITHWLKGADGSFVSRVAANEKAPLENRVWYSYEGQTDPTRIGTKTQPAEVARVLDDQTTQVSRSEYNDFGNLTKHTDPTNRVTSYQYATNGIDIIAVYQRTPNGLSTDPDGQLADKIAEYSYEPSDPPHLPRSIKDAARQPITYTYNSHGQILAVEDARHETTTYLYSDGTIQNVPNGYLASITSPILGGQSAVISFTYDSGNRVHTVTNSPDNYTITTDYDSLDRPTQIGYPDGTNQLFKYTEFTDGGVDAEKKLLDLTQARDRQGRWTFRHYDGNRRMDWIKDALLRKTSFDWCNCGSLVGITDPNQNITRFDHDLQSRVMSKTFAFGTPEAQTVLYAYEDTISRLKSMTDPIDQTTNYEYGLDDNVSHVTYTNAQNPTPNLTYTYDPYYNRVQSATSSGSGVINGTIAYNYYPVTLNPPTLGANRLHTVGGLLPNDAITYTYDELGRTVGQSIEGVSSTMQYDSLGRIDVSDNPLGHFSRTYDSVTLRLQRLNYPNGQTASYTYFGNDHDRRLQTLQNLASGSVNLSQFDYTYDAEGAIQSLNKLLGTDQTNLAFGYDPTQQLTSVTQGNLHFQYGYDDAGNRLTDLFFAQFSRGGNTFTANNLNQLDSVVRDPGVGPARGPVPITYDANGNMTSDGGDQTYEWDAANRLVAINYADTGNRTEFAYDGLGRRVRITEYGPAATAEIEPKVGALVAFTAAEFNLSGWQIGDVTPWTYTLNFQAAQYHGNDRAQRLGVTLRGATSTKTFVWSGNSIAEERDAAGSTVTKRFFAEGEQRIGGKDEGLYYYSRDHLGSIREMTDSTGGLVARCDYGPWGKSVVVNGNMNVDFGFTGHYLHQPSGMNLAMYRAYNPTLGRWISRDPAKNGEFLEDGPNLYAYVANNPVAKIDPLGLQTPGPVPTPIRDATPPRAWYGHYCGPGGSGTAIDALDQACKNHDECYARCGAAGAGGVISGGSCVRQCDEQLCSEAKEARCGTAKARAARAIIRTIF
jgi:RHS repeat-associated protein